ncbi:MAG: hypothetical protein Q7Q73_06975 [Verrucomicrobiota bacterium JB024]|nr:hypothetical protein [Verrucomicrobiota bacterium JB024]
MKALLLSAFTLIVFLSASPVARADTLTQKDNAVSLAELPLVLQQSIDSYLRGGNSGSATILSDNYPFAGQRAKFNASIRQAFSAAESSLGVIQHIEPILVRKVTASYRQYFLLYGYDNGVLFARITLYYAKNKDQVLECKFSRNADDFLPPLTENVEY